jgi:hypothetical protein
MGAENRGGHRPRLSQGRASERERAGAGISPSAALSDFAFAGLAIPKEASRAGAVSTVRPTLPKDAYPPNLARISRRIS